MSRPFEKLSEFIKTKMSMQNIYQPVFIKTLLENGGSATAQTVAQEILTYDVSQQDYYKNIVNTMTSKVVKKHEIVQKDAQIYSLSNEFKNISPSEARLLVACCDEKIAKLLHKPGDQHESYSERDNKCIFCNCKDNGITIVDENELCLAFRDSQPVTEGHTLIISKRHVSDYFDLYSPERNAIEELLQRQRETLKLKYKDITRFNVGVNCGEDAGQSIFHVHIHLIPRRKGDIKEPKGGVRGVIPKKQAY